MYSLLIGKEGWLQVENYGKTSIFCGCPMFAVYCRYDKSAKIAIAK
jgi:hypothetical protein